MLLLAFLLLFPLLRALQFRLSSTGILEVAASNGSFYPICVSSVRDEFVKTACSRDSSASPPSSSPHPLAIKGLALSVACTNDHCFTFNSPFCTHSLHVSCGTPPIKKNPPDCPLHSVFLGGRCISVISRVFPSYSVAKEACPVRVLSLSSEKDRAALSQLILHQFDFSLSYFTAGYRQGSTWTWEDGTPIEPPPFGAGRCLTVKGDLWNGTNCDSPGAVLCEQGPECTDGGYQGTHNITTSGQPCLRWNDPSVLFYGQTFPEQTDWNHNFCRVVRGSASCFQTPNKLAPCSIRKCEFPQQLRDVLPKDDCLPLEFYCGDGTCISAEFRCDYEVDCENENDEKGCEDFLTPFELVGALKLVDNLMEVWTNVPHIQGCAKRCSNSTILCEAFSYEPRNRLCLLSDSSQASSVTHRPTSLYYKRRYSPKDIEFSILEGTLLAQRNGSTMAVCGDNLSRQHATAVCSVAGFGLPMSHRVSFEPSTNSSQPGWPLDCIRYSSCENAIVCNPIRCSNCTEAVCGDGSKCITNSQICNKVNDCGDGSDEKDCRGAQFRLTAGSEVSGNVEVLVGDHWLPVCADSIRFPEAETICKELKLGVPNVLSPVQTTSGRRISCSNGFCSLEGEERCFTQARIRCSTLPPASGAKCGVRKIEVAAKDAAKERLARVVGGFQTAAGAFPWTAAIRVKATGAHHCGASILDETHLITAAHCFEDDRRPMSYVVVAGDWDNNATEGSEQLFSPIRLHFYPLYENLFSHDVAIVQIPEPGFVWNDYVQPICLPPRDFSYESDTKCVVSGWGSLGLEYPSRMQAAVLPIIDRDACISASTIYRSMSRTAFCAGYLEGGIDSCQGDSGGPYGCRMNDGSFVLAGVISWGDGCAQRNQPGIYTMVAPYLTWIENVINTKN